MSLIYLATPYNHPDPEVRELRFQQATEVAAYFMSRGVHLFCPIAHTHPIAKVGNLPHGWEYWREYDHAMLLACSELWIVKMPGWDESKGIAGEIEIATSLNVLIRYIDYPITESSK